MPFRSNKPARLEKARSTNDNTGSKSTPARYDENDETNPRSPNRYSIQTLSHQQLVTRQKQLLLRQFSDKSVETKRSVSSGLDQYADPKASTTSVNTIINDIEARSKIDVEQAINLLQELKKTASPDELVALHRALLPVKEDPAASTTQFASIEERAYTSVPPERKRSVMPPGLATRNSGSGDILRQASDPASLPIPTKSERGSWMDEAKEEKPRNESPSRMSVRSAQSNFHAGAFPSGSLRITNGAASPEPPSVISKPVLETDDSDEERSNVDTPTKVKPQPSIPSLKERKSQFFDSPRSRSSRTLDQAPIRPAGPRQAGSLDLSNQERAKVKEELRLDMPLQRHSFQHIPATANEHVPRFQQRWGHRAAHLSHEYLLDCDITESPYEEKNGLLEFAHRLSTVHDDGESDVGSSCEVDSRADALSKLTGGLDEDEANKQIGTARTSDEVEPASQSTPDKVVRKVDSGYCSDTATPVQRKTSVEATKSHDTPVIPEQPLHTNEPSDSSFAESQETDLPSSCTDTDNSATPEVTAHSSPSAIAALRSSPSHVIKSPLSLFKLKSKATKKSSFTLLNVQPGNSPATSEGVEEPSPAQPSPPSRQGDKKRLQKPMPESIRRQRKKTMENLKASSSHSPTVQNLLADVADSSKDEGTECFVGCEPNEAADADEKQDFKERSSRKRSKSFGRKRSKTLGESEKAPAQESTSCKPSRTRSKSNADATAPIPVRAASDAASAMNCLKSADPETPTRDRPVPTHTDFASVARALQSNPPDLSPDANRSAPVPKRSSMQRYYSVHKIDTAPERPPANPASSSADAGSAPDSNNEQPTEEEKIPATPAQQDKISIPLTPVSAPSTPVAVGSSYSVEDRFPEWQGKPSSPNSTPASSPSTPLCARPLLHSRSKSAFPMGVPPIPELPADIASKVSKADEMVAKKMRLSPRTSPNGSARNSVDSGDTRKQLLTKKVEARKDDSQRTKDARQATLDQLSVPREEQEDGSQAGDRNSARWSVDGSIQLPHPEQQAQLSSPTHDSQHPGWPGWEQQSNLWRQRRQALAESLDMKEQKQSEESPEVPCESPSAPGIVVSRYITPLGAENAHNAKSIPRQRTDSASKFAEAYTSLITDDKENTPEADMRRADSVVSTATFVTMTSSNSTSSQTNKSYRSSGESTYSTTATTVSSTTSWSNNRSPFNRERQQHMRTKSGRFLPYRPADAAQAERSRALSLARRSTQVAGSENLSASKSLSIPKQRPELKKTSSESLFDRYGGGMQYGWNRESGFVGSAGTRAGGDVDQRENRKSVKMSEDFGLDLSDIPVYLRREAAKGFRLKE